MVTDESRSAMFAHSSEVHSGARCLGRTSLVRWRRRLLRARLSSVEWPARRLLSLSGGLSQGAGLLGRSHVGPGIAGGWVAPRQKEPQVCADERDPECEASEWKRAGAVSCEARHAGRWSAGTHASQSAERAPARRSSLLPGGAPPPSDACATLLIERRVAGSAGERRASDGHAGAWATTD